MVDRSPRVFISYSHDSDDHADQVLALADRLRAEGIDVAVDQYEISPPEGWPSWMERQVRESDFVLVVCTEIYLRRAERREELGVGHGVIFESTLSLQHLYDAGMRNIRFIPVVFEDRDTSHIPAPHISTQNGYERLYRHLTGQAETPAPEVGKLRQLPRRERQWRSPPRIDDRGAQLAEPKLQLRQIRAKDRVVRYANCQISSSQQRYHPGEPLSVEFEAYFHAIPDDLPRLRQVEVGIKPASTPCCGRKLGSVEPYQFRSGIEIQCVGRCPTVAFAWKVRAPEADRTLHGRNAVTTDEPLFELPSPLVGQRLTLQMIAFANNKDFAPSKDMDIPNDSAGKEVISRAKEAIMERLKMKQVPNPDKNGEILLCETDNVVEEVSE